MQLPPYRVPNPAALRVGVIGWSFFAVNQVRAWATTSDVFIAALCDCHPERADRLASELLLGVPTFADATEMVDKVALDFLDIITTPATHPALVHLQPTEKCQQLCRSLLRTTQPRAARQFGRKSTLSPPKPSTDAVKPHENQSQEIHIGHPDDSRSRNLTPVHSGSEQG